MHTKALVVAAIAACLSTGSALAQSYDSPYRGERYDRYERQDRGDQRYEGQYRGEHGQWRGERYQRRHRQIEGAGPYRDIFVGERLPQAYWSGNHLVRNWSRRDLPPPRPGHTWKRVGNDYVMSSIHTGIIAAVVLR